MRLNRLALCTVSALTLLVAGCTSYYKINDPAGSKVYYTKDIDDTKSGSIHFKDQKTGGVITLQSSEVKEISKEEFEAAVKGGETKK